jgi:hypothetical protein
VGGALVGWGNMGTRGALGVVEGAPALLVVLRTAIIEPTIQLIGTPRLDGSGRDSLSWPHRDGLKWLHQDEVSASL